MRLDSVVAGLVGCYEHRPDTEATAPDTRATRMPPSLPMAFRHPRTRACGALLCTLMVGCRAPILEHGADLLVEEPFSELRGRVLEYGGVRPLEGVEVRAPWPQAELLALTQGDGVFELPVEARVLTPVIARLEGYLPAQRDAYLKNASTIGESLSLRLFALQRIDAALAEAGLPARDPQLGLVALEFAGPAPDGLSAELSLPHEAMGVLPDGELVFVNVHPGRATVSFAAPSSTCTRQRRLVGIDELHVDGGVLTWMQAECFRSRG